jgi:hypothetical protein
METQGPGGVPAADWYPDPAGRHEFRYWDGMTWTSNVSDRGQAAVDPVEAPAAPSASPVPVPPAAPTPSAPAPAGRGVKRLAILGAVVVLLAAAGVWGYSVVSASLAAKDAAAASIAAARAVIVTADLAVEPASQELTESQQSKAKLDEATSLLAQGSFVDAAPYRAAGTKADEARVIAQGITERVGALAADAAAASPEDAIGLYFDLARKYPRTQQGQDAVANAATALLGNLTGSDLDNLDAIKEFCDNAPSEVPTTVFDAAATSIKSIASASVDQQASVVSSNKSWVKKIRGKGVNFTLSSTSAADTSELTHIIGVLSAVHGTDFSAAVTALRDCSKLGQACGKIARSPVRRSGRVEYFSRTQINKIAKLSSQMAAKLTKARGLLEDL